jgi:ubiquinone/menaquinone biosynthesis C-methylase UbiE
MILPLVKPGDRVMELGPGLGFFTCPLAQTLGSDGEIVCVDVQASMLERLAKRLERRGLHERVQMRQCRCDDLGLDGEANAFDLVLALHVVHETPRPTETIQALTDCIKPGGKLLLVEPSGHCPNDLWLQEIATAKASGLRRVAHPRLEGKKQLALWRKAALQPVVLPAKS